MSELQQFKNHAEEKFSDKGATVENITVAKKLKGNEDYLYYVSALIDCKFVAGVGITEGKAVNRAIESLKDYEKPIETIVIE